MEFSKQTDSSIASIRGYGCYLCSLLALWQTAKAKRLLAEEIETIFHLAKDAGVIIDNDIKIGSDGWFRCFVSNPVGVFKIADAFAGTKSKASEKYRDKILTDTPAGCFSIIEFRTKLGSHFVAGRIEDGGPVVTYNPDPRISCTEVRTVRHWSVI